MAKMVLIEAHPLLRLGLWQILSKLDDVWEIEGMGLADLSKADGAHAGADLLIYGLPVETDEAWSALHEIQRVLTPKRILLLTDVMPLPMPVQGLPGASVYGCLMKTASVEILEAAIRLVMAGGQCFPSEQAMQAPASTVCALPTRDGDDASAKATMPVSAGAQLLQITPRQYEVLVLLARGYPIKTVSRMLNISVATAKTHACTLYQRLHVKNKGEAVYAALQRGATLEWHEPNNGRESDTGQIYGRKLG
ncbi:Response regulator protein vraR [Achromobacter spanius]|uniref:response regulator transcription factor n=1 Tax=Achromobacter spanius TaxID=217203 RepID=UPI000C2C9401|nr:response regulator transcription factor [Achromobacter spanius]AUA58774.1 DNA-binding response regulator [Achromobacter spanius]CAB3671237.1 Response regulator protein VraR [Achromobacter spanius]SPT40696.1 Response regulator protein vraR [Achromobacter denitrificans]VEE59075.1 Response regulator protein vraR [Achromobacter spanius]